jgi:general secretion pathway protein N
MMRKLAIGFMVLALSVQGGVSGSISAVSSEPPEADAPDGPQTGPRAISTWRNPVTPSAPVAAVQDRALSANPLWAIPLTQLPLTRDRPIFSPSRRPPPPAVAPAAVPKLVVAPRPSEPERPQFSLVGTVAGDDDGFGIFLDQATNAVFRLRVGGEYQGWKLRSVRGRETIVEKDRQIVPLALSQPTAERLVVEVPPPALQLLSVQPRPDARGSR